MFRRSGGSGSSDGGSGGGGGGDGTPPTEAGGTAAAAHAPTASAGMPSTGGAGAGGGGAGGGAGAKGEHGKGYVLNFAKGTITFTQAEADLYTALAAMVDIKSAGTIEGRPGATFLRRSGLTNDQLREIWRLACGGRSKPQLTKDDWFVAMKLVALVQTTGAISMDPLFAGEPVPFPNLSLNSDADTSVVPIRPDLSLSQMNVTVTNPMLVGSGISKYTTYLVTTQTELPNFLEKNLSVRRRFSDFLWLHDRLCATNGGCLIPSPPAKKALGNTEASFVAQRCNALDSYLRRVVRHPILGASYPVQIFLEASSEGWAAFVNLTTTGFAGGVRPEEVPTGAKKFFKSLWGSVKSVMPGKSTTIVSVPTDEQFALLEKIHGAMHGRLSRAVGATVTSFKQRRDVAYEISRLGHHVLEGAKHERIGESVGASALAERDRREAMEREASSGSGVGGGAAGAGAGGGSGAMGTPSAPPAANQWAGTAFGTAPAATGTDDGSSWAGAFGGAASMSNEAAARALFAQQDDVYNGKGGAVAQANTATPSRTRMLYEARAAQSAQFVAATSSKSAAAGQKDDGSSTAVLMNNFGNAVESVATLMQDQLDSLHAVFQAPLMGELTTAKSLNDAIGRRQQAVADLQNSHDSLASKKKAYAAARANAAGAAIAERNVTKAEEGLKKAGEKLSAVTETIKNEVRAREAKRRLVVTTMLLELVRAEARNARERNVRWAELIQYTTHDSRLLEASRQRIAKHTVAPEMTVQARLDAEQTAQEERNAFA